MTTRTIRRGRWCLLLLSVLVPGRASVAQPLESLPAWASTPIQYSDPEQNRPVDLPPTVDLFQKAFVSGFGHRSGPAYFGPWSFRSQCSSGIIEVVNMATASRSGGLNSGFAEVHFVACTEVPEPSMFPAAEASLVWTGRRGDGTFGVGILPINRATSIDHSSIVTPPVVSASGEAWLSAGIVAGKLYVLDAANARVLRFRCASAVFDEREAAFSATVPVSLRVPILGFRAASPSVPGVLATLVHKRRGVSPIELRDSGSGPVVTADESVPGGLSRASFKGNVRAGLTSLAIRGPVGTKVRLERAASAEEPFQPFSEPFNLVADPDYVTIGLAEAAAEGQRFRLWDVGRNEEASVTVDVLPLGPVIFGVNPVDAWLRPTAGSTIKIHGGNFGTSATLTWRAAVWTASGEQSAVSMPVTVTSVDPNRIVCTLPPQSGEGYLEIVVSTGTVRKRLHLK